MAAGQTISEGGFKKNKVSAASVLGQDVGVDKKGKEYYKYEMLVRTGEVPVADVKILKASLQYQFCRVRSSSASG